VDGGGLIGCLGGKGGGKASSALRGGARRDKRGKCKVFLRRGTDKGRGPESGERNLVAWELVLAKEQGSTAKITTVSFGPERDRMVLPVKGEPA